MNSFIRNNQEMNELIEVLNVYRKHDGKHDAEEEVNILDELLECSNPMILIEVVRRIGKQFTISKHLYNNCLREYGHKPDFIMYVLDLNLFVMEERNNNLNGINKPAEFTEREIYTMSEIMYRFYDVKNGIAENSCGPLFVIKAKPEIYEFI